ncbi:MAG: LPS-assembly protein LptD [Muribaculaceae bacterium]|nr:LPS-assembly protein LptD [Muribaculaceae bacterium]
MQNSRRNIIILASVLFTVISLWTSPSVSARKPDINAIPDSTAVNLQALNDSVTPVDLQALNDSLKTDSPTDSLAAPVVTDSIPKPPSRIRRQKIDLDNVVNIKSTDSMIMLGRNRAFIYGGGQVDYGTMKLDADEIDVDLQNSTVYAMGRPDSVGEMVGTPVFEEGGSTYETKTMSYNFKTKRAFITDVVTQQGEGYLTGGHTKKTEDEDYYVQNGRYTTCDDHEHPHFWFQLTKAKVKPKKNVVTGPVYLVLAGLPLPLALPFGYFPFSDKYASGIIVPTFGDDYNRGFYLSDGGYYFAINDNIDLALTGEIYTRGSWGLNAQSTYAKRYKYSGNFTVNYLTTILGDKGQADYSKQNNFQVVWSHSQDSKANPNMSLSASVNFTTSGYSRNDLNSYYSSSFTESTKSSTVNMTYRFPRSKWSLSTTMNIAQRTQDSTLTVSFPNVTVSMAQLAPFKRKNPVGEERWYEKIRISYSGLFQNSLTSPQDEFFKKSLIKDWRNGMKHSMPISATFNVFKYINVTPSLQLNDRMYSRKIRRQWDPNASAEVCDTNYSFYNVWDFSASLSFDTKIYGFWKPLPFLGDKVKMIRHVMTPTVSFSGSPDFGSPFFGYYGQYEFMQNGKLQTRRYSYFANSMFGVPGEGKSGTITFSLANNLEMKVKSDNDSIGEKKVSLIENLSLSQSYNMAADSLKWSNINSSIMLRLMKGFNLNLSATWDVYTYQLNDQGNPVRVNRTRLQAGKGLAKLSSTGTSFSYTLNNETFKKKKDGDKKNNKGKQDNNPDNQNGSDRPQRFSKDDETEVGDDGYVPWSVPWNLTFNYSVSYGYGSFNREKMDYNGKLTQNLSFSGSIRPTKNWSMNFSASYNFDTHKIAYMNCNISRDLHCFSMTASVIPVGPYKSYNFHIAVKSAMLSDVKYDKRSSSSNGVKWY